MGVLRVHTSTRVSCPWTACGAPFQARILKRRQAVRRQEPTRCNGRHHEDEEDEREREAGRTRQPALSAENVAWWPAKWCSHGRHREPASPPASGDLTSTSTSTPSLALARTAQALRPSQHHRQTHGRLPP